LRGRGAGAHHRSPQARRHENMRCAGIWGSGRASDLGIFWGEGSSFG
jgi:hypothetical protein